MKRYPFKFLDAYTRDDRDIFFGREEEVEALYEMVFQADLLLVYGASGTGKTSLIQCGLASKFESHDWLALNIRRGKNLNVSFEKTLHEAGGTPDENAEDLDWLDEGLMGERADSPLGAGGELALARSLRAVYLKHFKPIYLIFDQFEELYILGDKEEQAAFIETIKEILRVEQPVKVILSIREEYLGHLYEFERQVPELLRKKLRVEPMHLDKVKTVMKNVGSLPGGNVRLKNGEEDKIAEGIFEKIRGKEKTLGIQLPYLQVFLDKLYLQITGDQKRQSDALFTAAALSEMGDIGDVLRNFLDEQVLATADALGQKPATIWKILSPFVTLEGTKEPMSEALLTERLSGLPPQLVRDSLRAFVDSRILRFTEREGLYEVAHDSLAKQVHAKRSDEEIALLEVRRLIQSQVRLRPEAREFFTEKQLLFIEPFLGKLKLTAEEREWIRRSEVHVEKTKAEEERKKAAELAATRRRLRVVRGLLAAAVLALGVAGYFWKNANKEKQKTEAAKVETEDALNKAETLVNAFYFYEDRFALAYGKKDYDNVFYFIDKSGKEVSKLGRWEKAEQFNWRGFAKIKKEADGKMTDFLLDTLGNTYRLAYDTSQLNANIEALDLSEKELTTFPSSILKHNGLKILLLNKNQLTGLPAEIGQLQNLTSLDLGGNGLTALPAEIGQLQDLSSLELGGNQLTALPAEIGQLQDLSSLGFGGNGLTALPAEILQLQNLTSLDLGGNGLTGLPAEIGRLQDLSSLDLGFNKLTVLPAEIVQLQNLSSLDLRYNGLTALPAEIGQLQNLTSLDLRFNQLTALPAEIGQLQNLSLLYLSSNQLTGLPAEIGQLQNLSLLQLSSNQLTGLPAEIGQLQNLSSLYLRGNGLTALPAEILQLQNLTSLVLSENQLTALPAEIGQLQDLSSLVLNYNELMALPAEIGQLQNLTSLDLRYNGLTGLPAEIGQLQNLTSLDLRYNGLTVLPAEIGQLQDLSSLVLNYNELMALPVEIGQLQNLTSLDLGDNDLTALPAEIFQLQNLTSLDLGDNDLTALPAEIFQLQNLTSLDLWNNELTALPAEIGQLQNLTSLVLWSNPIPKEEQEKIRQLLPNCRISF